MSTKHTPGPWKAAPFRVQIPLADGGHVDGPLMSYFVGGRHSGEGMTVTFASERVVDQYLAAAAPELLAALRECVNLMTALQVSPHHHRDVVALARAAIDKATGVGA